MSRTIEPLSLVFITPVSRVRSSKLSLRLDFFPASLSITARRVSLRYWEVLSIFFAVSLCSIKKHHYGIRCRLIKS
jgi:hypothetical protein